MTGIKNGKIAEIPLVTLAVVSTRHICGGATRRAIIRSGWVGKTESAGTRDSRSAGRRACPIAEAVLTGATARDTGTTLTGLTLAGITARDTGAGAGVTRQALAAIAGSSQAGCATHVSIRTAGAVEQCGSRWAGALTRSGVTGGTTAAHSFPITVATNRCTRFGKDSANPTQSEDTAKRGGGDCFEGLAARGRCRQGFGQVVKCVRFHCRLLLPP